MVDREIKVLVVGEEEYQDKVKGFLFLNCSPEMVAVEEAKTRMGRPQLRESPLDLAIIDGQHNADLFRTFETRLKNNHISLLELPPMILLYKGDIPEDPLRFWLLPRVLGVATFSRAGEVLASILNSIAERKGREEQESSQPIQFRTPWSSESFESEFQGVMARFASELGGVLQAWDVEDPNQEIQKIQRDFEKIPATRWVDFYCHLAWGMDLHTGYSNELKKGFISPLRSTSAKVEADFLREFQRIFRGREKAKRALNILLVTGETGTGKTLIARWVRRYIAQKRGVSSEEEIPYSQVNISAIGQNLLETELFGGIAGAYTSLNSTTPGRILLAYGGVCFFDEIGDLSKELQCKLLTFLDSGGVRPTGWVDPEPLYAPVCIVAATNRRLEDAIRKDEFRYDLYCRFTHRIHIPPLRERKEDLTRLIFHVLSNPVVNRLVRVDGPEEHQIKEISEGCLTALRQHDYPGNFRELESILRKAVQRAHGRNSRVILSEDIDLEEESALREQEAAFILPKTTKEAMVYYLLRWNPSWKTYHFIGGRFDLQTKETRPDITIEDTFTREMKEKLEISYPNDYTYRPLLEGTPLRLVQYSRRDCVYKLYLFYFFALQPVQEGQRWQERLLQYLDQQQEGGLPLFRWFRYDDIDDKRHAALRISQTVVEVKKRLKDLGKDLTDISFELQG